MNDLNPEFVKALGQAMDDHDRYGEIRPGDNDFTESGEMRAIGITRSDAVRLALSLHQTYGHSLATGWDCPECGRLCDEDGECPDGHEFTISKPEARKLESMIAIAEICLSVGVHLERNRWEGIGDD